VTRDVDDAEQPAPGTTSTTPDAQVSAYRKQIEAWPQRVIRRGDAVRPLPSHARSLADLTFDGGDARLSVSDYMARRRTAGVLILKDGEIALERYDMRSSPETVWTSFSTAKSMTATLCGAALHDGAIGSVDDRCDLYLPRLRGSAYEGVTIRNVMRMCSGVAWSEADDGRSDGGGRTQALASRRPGAILDLLCSLPRAQPQGVASGSFGQYIYVHPVARVVAVIRSAWRQHDDNDAAIETFALLRAALLALRADPTS
jgi:CubicO group peptidase (beta-lactamase class C family)